MNEAGPRSAEFKYSRVLLKLARKSNDWIEESTWEEKLLANTKVLQRKILLSPLKKFTVTAYGFTQSEELDNAKIVAITGREEGTAALWYRNNVLTDHFLGIPEAYVLHYPPGTTIKGLPLPEAPNAQGFALNNIINIHSLSLDNINPVERYMSMLMQASFADRTGTERRGRI